ncbi:POZ domain-containing protein [Ascobolus immersus RN42]|uniref:POZ domain-containing protein n=1 Tax=Ascobolus immersus RN42 TaxID=1160509 RepID=A0A3N4HEE7_ASCIM|nr:POZ domain-containing protein [Ascobolus immersus RN42]
MTNEVELNINNKRPFSESDESSSKRPTLQPIAASLRESNLGLLESGDFSDLILRCEGESLKVHKAFLSPQSEFFRGCIQSGMKESATNEIVLVDENLKDVKLMLEYLYDGWFWEHESVPEKRDRWHCRCVYDKYVNPKEERTEEEKQKDPLIVCVRLYRLADKFGIPGLKKAVIKKFKQYKENNLEFNYSGELFPEERRSNILGQWHRLLDALEFCYSYLDDQPDANELADILLHPLAQAAPFLMDPKDKTKTAKYDFWESKGNLKALFSTSDCLTQRLNRSAQFASRLAILISWDSLKRIRVAEKDERLMDTENFRKETRKIFKVITTMLDDPPRIEALRCTSNSANGWDDEAERCNSTRPMVPVVETGLGDYAVGFECRECQWDEKPDTYLGQDDNDEEEEETDVD